jgi:hypothetical protein
LQHYLLFKQSWSTPLHRAVIPRLQNTAFRSSPPHPTWLRLKWYYVDTFTASTFLHTLRNETESQFIELKTWFVHNADFNSDISDLLVHAQSNYVWQTCFKFNLFTILYKFPTRPLKSIGRSVGVGSSILGRAMFSVPIW